MATEGERTAPTSCLSAAACPRMALSTRPHVTLASRSAAAGARRELCTLSPACLPVAADQRAGDVWAHGEKGGGGYHAHGLQPPDDAQQLAQLADGREDSVELSASAGLEGRRGAKGAGKGWRRSLTGDMSDRDSVATPRRCFLAALRWRSVSSCSAIRLRSICSIS